MFIHSICNSLHHLIPISVHPSPTLSLLATAGLFSVSGVWMAVSDAVCCPLLQRPYEIHSATPIDEILNMFKVERVHYSSTWCKGMVALLKKVRGQPPVYLARELVTQCRNKQTSRLRNERTNGGTVVKIPKSAGF